MQCELTESYQVLPRVTGLFHWLKVKSVSSDFPKFAVNPKLKKVVEIELLRFSSKIFISVKNFKSNFRNACHLAWCYVTDLLFDILGLDKLLFIAKWSRRKETQILFFSRISTNRLRGRLFLFEDIFHLSSRFNLIQAFSNWKEKLEASLNSMWHYGKIIGSAPSLSVCINWRYVEIISQERAQLQTESRET